MASPTNYDAIHELLVKKPCSIQFIVDELRMSRVTVTKVVKTSDDIIEHQTWPRTYSLTPDSKYRVVSHTTLPTLSDKEKELAGKYLEHLLKPGSSLDLAVQFQAVDSVEGADSLIKALTDCIKVAQYYKELLRG